MPAESIFAPIRKDLIRQARSRLALAGLTVADWATKNGFKTKTVYQVLSGDRMAIRGDSLRIAIALGLRPDPDSPAPSLLEGLPVDHDHPAGRTIAGGPSVPHRNRGPVSQLGEAVR